MLNFVLFLPLVGAFFLLFIPRQKISFVRIATLFFQVSTLLIGVYIAFLFDLQLTEDQFFIKKTWISFLNIHYALGLDGLSLVLCLVTVFLFPLVSFGTWNINPDKEKYFWLNVLTLETGLLGVFLARDVFLFYFFWEVVLIPMYFIIVLWGEEKKITAAIEFFIYTMASSFFMLFAIFFLAIASFYQLGAVSFDLEVWKKLSLGNLQYFFFWAFFIPFAVKIPLFPFHSWMPATYKNAPWLGTILLSALLSKMGIYGLFRFVLPLFPEASQRFHSIILFLAVASVLYAATVAIQQKDLKMIIAYSSVSHLGFIVLGIFSLHLFSWNGAILQIVNHSLTTAAIFLILGLFSYHFRSTNIGDFFGLAKITPKFCVLFFLFTLSAIGFPSTGSFVGELFIFLGSFQTALPFACFAALGVVLSVLYMLRVHQKIFFGETNNKFFTKKDVSFREFFVLFPLVVFTFWIGLYPQFFFVYFESYVRHSLSSILIHLL